MTERRVVFGRLAWAERVRLGEILRREVVGGVLLLIAAAVALVWANSAWRDAYFDLTQFTIGPQSWGFRLTLADWAGEGLLALFFFVAGLELKRELVVGSLRNRSDALLPIAAAVGGMALPALIYLAFTSSTTGAGQGWGIPIATDIAFALAVLAIIGRGLPPALRAFLLTLAVVDDLGAITVIALFYSDALAPLWLLGSVALVIVYLFLQKQRVQSPLVYVPLALALWGFVHSSGIHATVAGVVLGLATRVVRDPGEELAPAERLEERLRPISAGFAVPVFAFFSAGVTVVGTSLATIASNPVTQGVAVGLVAGKGIGIFVTTLVVVRFTKARLGHGLKWVDIFGLALISGIGFTVSLLIAELSFAETDPQQGFAKISILFASLLAALLASVVLLPRSRAYRALAAREDRDLNDDGIPDVYQRTDDGGDTSNP